MTNYRHITRGFVVGGLLLLTGCFTSGVKVPDAQLASLTKGQTSCADIVTQLGMPTLTERKADGASTLTYSSMQTKVRPESYAPLVGMFLYGQTTTTTSIIVSCDSRNLYAGHATSQGQSQMGYGGRRNP